DQRVIDPGPDALAGLLAQAFNSTDNSDLNREALALPAFRAFARAAADEPEGTRRWEWDRRPADRMHEFRAVGCAWWTDGVNRKHWRVVAQFLPECMNRLAGPFFNGLRERPPLWLVHPERVFLDLHRGGLVCVCECGASGPPAALAWTGQSCGPCFDRRQELSEEPADDFAPISLCEPFPSIMGVALAADGRMAACAHKLGFDVTLIDVTARRRMTTLSLPATLPMTFSPDGRMLSVGSQGGQVHRIETATGRMCSAIPVGAAVWHLRYLPTGSL